VGTTGHLDAVIATVSARQDGVITTEDLVEAGLSRKGIQKRVKRGALHRL
jgi:hypothetical protein